MIRNLRNDHHGNLFLLLTRLALAAALLSGCVLLEPSRARPAPEPLTVTVAGSTEMRPLLLELTAAYSERNPHLHFVLHGGGSRLGEERLVSGGADIAASTDFYPDAELPADLVRVPIGLDGIALIVHGDNPIAALTLTQVRDIFHGRALFWEDVGGEGGEVLLVSREDGSATRALFEERVMGEEGVSLTAVVMPTSSHVVKYVAANPAAIGYVTSAYIEQDGESSEMQGTSSLLSEAGGQVVKAVSVEGRLPYGADLADAHYLLARPLYLLFRESGDPALEDVVSFALGAEGQDIVARYHVPVR